MIHPRLKDKWLAMGYDQSTFSHRELLNGIIEKYFPFESFLDVGAATGPDMYMVGLVMPSTKRVGFDREIENVKQAQDMGLEVYQADLTTHLEEIPDKSYDIVLSNGVIMYNNKKYLSDLIRIAKKAVVLSERGETSEYTEPLKELGFEPLITKVTEDIRQSWMRDGYIYEITNI